MIHTVSEGRERGRAGFVRSLIEAPEAISADPDIGGLPFVGDRPDNRGSKEPTFPLNTDQSAEEQGEKLFAHPCGHW